MKREDKIKIYKKIFKFCFWCFFITFLTLYLSQATGYYEYQQHKKVTFTNEQIEKFEKDVIAGKNVDIESYLEDTTKSYNNKTSKLGYTISNTIGKYVKDGLDNAFEMINKAMQEE